MAKTKRYISGNSVHFWVTTIVSLLVWASIAWASVGEVAVSVTSSAAESGTAFTSQVTIDVGEKVLGAYDLTITYDPTVIKIESISGAGVFSSNTFSNPVGYDSGSTKFVAFQNSSLVEPSGTVHVADIQWRATGSPGSSSPIHVVAGLISDTRGRPITMQAFDGSINIKSLKATDPSTTPAQPTDQEPLPQPTTKPPTTPPVRPTVQRPLLQPAVDEVGSGFFMLGGGGCALRN